MANEPSNGQIYTTLLDLKQGMGRVEAGISANAQHTLAVSRKADDIRRDLETHKLDTAAHGAGVEQQIEDKRAKKSELSLSKIVAAIAIIELVIHIAEPLVRGALLHP